VVCDGQAKMKDNMAETQESVIREICGRFGNQPERLMVVPLLAGSAVLGAMAVWRSGGSPFEARELAFLEGWVTVITGVILSSCRRFTGAGLLRMFSAHKVLGLYGLMAYNVAWMKIDPLWVAIIRSGLMPFATRIFERVLRLSTQSSIRDDATVPRHASALSREQSWIVLDEPRVNHLEKNKEVRHASVTN